MTDIHEEHGNEPKPKKSNIFEDILYGFFLSVAAYIMILFIGIGTMQFRVVNALIDFGLLGGFIFLTVKYFRTGRPAAAVTMLILISPAILVFLMTGACFLF